MPTQDTPRPDQGATPTTICDCCASEVRQDETSTCYCGIVVCDACMDNEHYQCADIIEGASS